MTHLLARLRTLGSPDLATGPASWARRRRVSLCILVMAIASGCSAVVFDAEESVVGGSGVGKEGLPPGASMANDEIVRGRVTDVTGRPIPGVNYHLTLPKRDYHHAAALVTTDEGAYQVPIPQPGRYKIAFRRNGIVAVIEGQIRAGETVIKDVVLG